MTFRATFLEAARGRALRKIFTSTDGPGVGYSAGNLFKIHERKFATFAEFVDALACCPSNQCLIRGRPNERARERATRGLPVRRTCYAKAGKQAANFESAKRNWLVLDFDKTKYSGVSELLDALPWRVRAKAWAWFPSASAHLHSTLRGKLVLGLNRSISDAEAKQFAIACGADTSVCNAVTPNYFAAPEFRDCADPINRAPTRSKRLDQLWAAPEIGDIAEAVRRELGETDAIPEEIPNPTKRARRLAKMIQLRWRQGGRIESNAALHLFGWLLGQRWDKGEIASLLTLLDANESDAAKVAEHRKILGNAIALDGPGGFRDWIGAKWDRVDAHVNAGSKLTERGEFAGEQDVDPWTQFLNFSEPMPLINWLIPDLRLAPSKGKISMIGGQPGAGKGPLAAYIAICVALGLPLFGELEVRQCNVGWIDLEGSYLTALRMRRMMAALGRDPKELDGKLYMLDGGPIGDLRTPENCEALARLLKDKGLGFLGLDSYTAAMLDCGVEANQPEFASLARALGRHGTTVLAVAHANKASAKNGEPRLNDLAYSGALASQAQSVLFSWQPDPDDEYNIALTCGRSPTTKFGRRNVVFSGDDPGPLHVLLSTSAPVETDGATERAAKRATKDAVRNDAQESRLTRLVKIVKRAPQGITTRLARDAAGIAGRDWETIYELALQRKLIRVARSLPSDKYPTLLYVEKAEGSND